MPTLFSLAHIELLSKYSAPCSIDVAILVEEDAFPIQHSFKNIRTTNQYGHDRTALRPNFGLRPAFPGLRDHTQTHHTR